MNKKFAGRFKITDVMLCGKQVKIINKPPTSSSFVFLILGYSKLLTIRMDTTPIITNESSILNIFDRYNDPRINAVEGIGNPMNLSLLKLGDEFESTLNLESLIIPHNTIKRETSILMYGILKDVVAEYKSIPGATPNDITSDNESIFFPNPTWSTLLVLRATQPSKKSNITAKSINLAASTKSPLDTIMIAINPKEALIKEIKSGNAI